MDKTIFHNKPENSMNNTLKMKDNLLIRIVQIKYQKKHVNHLLLKWNGLYAFDGLAQFILKQDRKSVV